MFKIYYRVNPAPVSLNGTGGRVNPAPLLQCEEQKWCWVKVEDIMLIVYG